MNEMAKETINYELPEEITAKILEDFYFFMRKYGIYRSTRNANDTGVIYNNFDWTMYQTLFTSIIKNQIEFEMMLDDTPEDTYYEK